MRLSTRYGSIRVLRQELREVVTVSKFNLISWFIAVLAWSVATAQAQTCPDEIYGGWQSRLAVRALFDISMRIEAAGDDDYTATIKIAMIEETVPVWRDGPNLRLQSAILPLVFDGRFSDNGDRIEGFIGYASNLYRITLIDDTAFSWSVRWSPLPIASDSVSFDLYLDDDGAGGTAGYFFFRDQRLPGLFAFGTACDEHGLQIGEKNLGLQFDGTFDIDDQQLRMNVTGPGGPVKMIFNRMSVDRQKLRPGTSELPPRDAEHTIYADHAPPQTDDGLQTAKPSDAGVDVADLQAIVTAVADGELPLTHSILVALKGKLIFEEYFYGYDRDMLHDMRSASKTITSTLIGLAIDNRKIENSQSTVLPFFPEYRSYENWNPLKAKIRVRDLLTMSSGLDANDSDRKSVAAEGVYQSQTSQTDWIKLALDAPMIGEPGTQPLYGGANPLILGGILDNVAGERVEWFAERYLFAPLGISKYRIFLDPTGVPYMGGGMYLRPRDMLKYGQMYLDGGRWLGRQLLSESWVDESFGKYGRLAPLKRNGNQYGYLWWHHQYEIDSKTIDSIEARGNGGQYIFVVPAIGLVAVVTSGNYRTGLTRQPQTIFEQYILPAVLNE